MRRNTQRSMTSFLISLSVHLTLVLISLFLWFIGQGEKSIDLNGQFVEVNDFEDSSIQISLPENNLDTIDSEVDSLELTEWESVEYQPELSEFNNLEQVDFLSTELGDFGEISWNASWASGSLNYASADSRGASFFGIPPDGDRIVYLIDMSPSMQVGKYQSRFLRAVNEVLRSVDSLSEDQHFMVIMFSFTTHRIRIGSHKDFAPATSENKEILAKKIRSMRLSNGTDPREAIVTALKLKPSCIFMLSDGEFNGQFYRNGSYGNRISAFELAVQYNKNNCPIHTIGLEEPLTQVQLSQIAQASAGTHVFVPSED